MHYKYTKDALLLMYLWPLHYTYTNTKAMNQDRLTFIQYN